MWRLSHESLINVLLQKDNYKGVVKGKQVEYILLNCSGGHVQIAEASCILVPLMRPLEILD